MLLSKTGIIGTIKWIFIFICIGACLLFLNFNSFTPIKYATTNLNAFWKSQEENNYIIHNDKNGLGTYVKKGWNREYVTLIGRNPFNEISGRLVNNRILIEGEFEDEMSEYYNKKIIRVTNWEVIFPVTREYSMSDYQKTRLIGPLFFIDQFDIESGDMHEYKNAKRSITGVEAKFLINKNKSSYFIVTPETTENGIKWHNVLYKATRNHSSETPYFEKVVSRETVHLTGKDLPEEYLNNNVIFTGNNEFLLYGTRQASTISVESWQITTPFDNRATSAGNTFLEEADFKTLVR